MFEMQRVERREKAVIRGLDNCPFQGEETGQETISDFQKHLPSDRVIVKQKEKIIFVKEAVSGRFYSLRHIYMLKTLRWSQNQEYVRGALCQFAGRGQEEAKRWQAALLY